MSLATVSVAGMPDGAWEKARCPGCARWISLRPKMGGFRTHKIGLKPSDPICPGGGGSIFMGRATTDAEARVRAILDGWSEEDREEARKILNRRRR